MTRFSREQNGMTFPIERQHRRVGTMGLGKSDASFFDLVHNVLQSEKDSENKRRRKRHDYFVPQMVAPYDGKNIPQAPAFITVDCHDLSTDGFSFVGDLPTAVELLVVALGPPQERRFLVARVMHRTAVLDSGTQRYLVGCSFVGRIRAEDSPLLP